MAAEAPDPPLKNSAAIHKPSRYRMDHPDYAGLSPTEKRRAIVSRLRSCSIGVIADELSVQDRARVRATVPGAITNPWQRTQLQAQSNGIVWCRAVGRWWEDGNYVDNHDFIHAGSPVIFDVYTGNSVAPYASNTDLGAWSRDWGDDEMFIVGKAMATATKVKDGATEQEDLWQVPVQLIPHNPVHDFHLRAATAFAQPIAGSINPNTGEILPTWTVDPVKGYKHHTRSEPMHDTFMNYGIDPCGLSSSPTGGPAWADMQILSLQNFSHYYEPQNPSQQKHMLSYSGRTRVFNWTPFGYGNDVILKIQNAGEFWVVEKPLYAQDMPYASLEWNVTDVNTNFTSGGIVLKGADSLGVSSNSIVGSTGYGADRKHYYLPRIGVRYNIHIESIFSIKEPSGVLRSIPFGMGIAPFPGQIPLDHFTNYYGASVRTPVSGTQTGGEFYNGGGFFGGTIVGPVYYCSASYVAPPFNSSDYLSNREVYVYAEPGYSSGVSWWGRATITPIW